MSQAKFERYEVYKDSGVDWIEEAPTHWELKRLKDIGISIIGITYSPDDVLDNEADGILVLRSSNIQNGQLSLLDNVYVSKNINTRQILRKGDILICSRNGSRALIGKNICIDERTEGQTFGAFMTVYRSRDFKFASKFFNSNVFESQSGLFGSSTVNQLTINTLNNFLIILPPRPEQSAIAAYLDTKTAQIDRKIDLLNQKATQYAQLKQALINETVTRGLDKTVPLKDSGVEWIGDVPAHWEVKRVKDLSMLQSGSSIGSEEIEEKGLYPIYGGNGLRGYISRYTNDGPHILIGRQGALCGNINYASGKFWASEHAVVVYLNRFIDMKWYGEMLRVMNLNQYSISAAQPGLAVDRIKRLLLPVPPFAEQQAIAAYLDEKTAHIDRIIATFHTQIDKLKELRKTLINDVVTGKIRVVTEGQTP